jgi:cytoskeletal protein CcmA (bactofilin family)
LVGKNAPTTDDNKDRGIEFRWHDGTSAKIGFFGFDDSTGKFTFIPDASNSSEVFSGSLGEINANITWNNVIDKPTFVNSLTGTPNEINVTSTTGAIVISLPSTAAINISGTSAGWTTPRKITLSGDLEGNVIVDGGSNVTLNANIIANAVSLGTDTTGDYVANIAAGTGITITNGSGEQSQPIIAVTNNTYDAYGSAATAEANAAADASTKAATAYNNATTYVNNQLSSFAVDSLSDVTVNTSLPNSYLKYNGSTWVNDEINLASDTVGNYVQNLVAGTGISIINNSGEAATPTVALNANLNDISNVAINSGTLEQNQVLIWDGQDWVNGSAPPTSDGYSHSEIIGDGAETEFTITFPFIEDDVFVTIQSATPPYEVIQANWEIPEQGKLKVNFSHPPLVNSIKVTAFSNISSTAIKVPTLTSLDDVYLSGATLLPGQILYTDGHDWFNHFLSINDLQDVDISTPATPNQFLKYNGNSWVNASIPEINNIEDIGDVVVTSASNGELLQYDGTNWVNSTLPSKEPTGFMDRTSSQISMSGRTFTISPTSGSFSIWCGGRRYIKASSESVQIDDISGLYYIYYNSSGILSYKTTYFDFENEAPVAYIYWNQGGNTDHFFADERHGVAMDWATHEYLHRTRGAAIANGFGIAAITDGSGNNNSHAQISLAAGTFFDEDIEVQIIDQATPNSNTWEQVLSPIAKIPVFYKSGNAWVKDQATNYPLKYDSGRSMYNSYSGGTWSSTEISNNRWGISWLIATNNLNEPVIAILGQQEYSSSNLAEDAVWEDLNLDGFPIFEFRPLHKIIYYTSNTYTNQPKTAITAVWDLRRITSTGGSVPTTPVTDHGSMTGLLDDDHTQYLNTARHDAHDHGAAFANTSNATLGGNLVVTGNFSVNGSMIATSDVTVSGNLTVNGSTVTINSETLVVEDKTIELGTSLSPSNTTADGSGIVIPDGTTNKTFIWVNSTGSWTLSEHLNLAINKVIKMNGIEVLSATNYIGHAASASQATIASAVTANSVTPSMLQEGPAKAAFRSEILTINSDSYTLIISDLSKLILMNNTSPMTVTIPSESNVAFDNGDRIDVTRYGTGSLTFAAQPGVTLKSTPGLKLRAQYSTATLTKLGTNEWLIVGDLAA